MPNFILKIEYQQKINIIEKQKRLCNYDILFHLWSPSTDF